MTQAVGIGELIAQLSEEFPDLTVSKVRFLEAKGILTPSRTPGGYRRFTVEDRERLVYTLRAQRDHFLPLRVIAEHLEAMSRGLTPALMDPTPRAPELADDRRSSPFAGHGEQLRMTSVELRRETGLTRAQLSEAQAQRLLAPDEEGLYGTEELAAARAVAALAELGLSSRHLRAVRLAADRIIGVVDQATQASERDLVRQAERADAINEHCQQLVAALLYRHKAEVYDQSDG